MTSWICQRSRTRGILFSRPRRSARSSRKLRGSIKSLYALLAGTGLRIEEAFALQVEDIEHSVIHVRHSMWNGKLYSPKTAAGLREVDIHHSLTELLHI